MRATITTLLFIVLPNVGNCGSSADDLVNAAIERTRHSITYDGSYLPIDYPNGDVPADTGVCTDLVIRAYRAIGVDLQRLVHEDMLSNFEKYPSRKIWGLGKPDSNIDHRRVPNLQVFLSRKGKSLTVSGDKYHYRPGDIVTWTLPGNLPHIGIVTDKTQRETGNPLVVHNIGAGPKIEDMLFHYPISGHYRYVPPG